MEKILDTFKSILANNPDCTVNFPIDADDPESIKFIQYLCENNGLIEHNGKVVFCPFGNNVEEFVCGIAPIWKDYSDKKTFEGYYKNSDMMRTLFCNEKDDNDQLAPMFLDIGGVKYIVTWEANQNDDIFHYRKANAVERGLLDLLWSTFGGITRKEEDIEVKQLNPQIGVSLEFSLNKQYGYYFGLTKKIYDHAYELGYTVGGNIQLGIG